MVEFIFNNVSEVKGDVEGSFYILDSDTYTKFYKSKVFECRIDDVTVEKINNARIHKKKDENGKIYFTVSSFEEISNEPSTFSISTESIEKAAKMIATTFTDSQALRVPDLYDPFEFGHEYKKDDRFTYNGILFKVNQDHTSQEQWIPGESGTESLYGVIKVNSSGYDVWKQPTGAHDAYNIGDIVEYKGILYKSLIDGNVWAPDVYPRGWQEYDASTSTEPSTPDPGTETPTEPSEPDYPDFVQPTGAHDAYKKGDIVRYNGKLYQSLIDGNAYSPDAYPQGWQEYSEE